MIRLKQLSFHVVGFLLIAFAISGCDKNNNVSLFSIENDKQLGQQVSEQIANDPEFTLLDRSQYPQAYSYLDGMVKEILNSGEVAYKDEFVWDVTIVQDDSTLNAFATPGGYIYIYTGLIKYLETADALAGVVGHEIAHADLRHSSQIIQKQYAYSVLISVITGGNPGLLGEVTASLLALQFSKEYEYESDEKAVIYNNATSYQCDGVKDFFEKLESEGDGVNIPEFLSTHPSPDNRIEEINAKAAALNCGEGEPTVPDTDYENFKTTLP